MKTIRFYGEEINPEAYRKGVSGFWLLFVNRLRDRLETYIVKKTLWNMINTFKLTKAEKKRYYKKILSDPSLWKKTVTSKTVSVPFFKTAEVSEEQVVTKRAERYKKAKQLIPIEEGMKKTFAAFQKKNDRSARYVIGNKLAFGIYEDFEEVSNGKDTGTAKSGTDRS